MSQFQLNRRFIAFCIFLFTAVPFYQEWTGGDSSVIFPLYSWELSFGHIHQTDYVYQVYLTRLNGADLGERVLAEEIIASNWKNPTSYKIAGELIKSIEGENTHQAQRSKMAFEHEYFKQNRIRNANYEIDVLIVDPLKYYKSGHVLETQTFRNLEYSYE